MNAAARQVAPLFGAAAPIAQNALTLAAFGASAALAAETSAGKKTSGTIELIDRLDHAVARKNGDTFNVAESVNLANLKAGEKIAVSFTKSIERGRCPLKRRRD